MHAIRKWGHHFLFFIRDWAFGVWFVLRLPRRSLGEGGFRIPHSAFGVCLLRLRPQRGEPHHHRGDAAVRLVRGVQQFRSIEIIRVVKKAVPWNQFTKNEAAAAAELALKAHVLAFDPEILAGMTDGARTMREIADAVDLTEAPEDAVCSLVIDLMQYCGRERIDWNQEVMSRVWTHLRNERVHEAQER
jgi:hypothetical protein